MRGVLAAPFVLCLAGLVCACARPHGGAAGGPIDASDARPPGTATASASVSASSSPPTKRTVASIRFGNQSKTGGVDLVLTPDGAARGSYFNPGFSKGGAEIVPIEKKLAPARVAELWAAADAVIDALPTARESADGSWKSSSSVALHLADGSDDVFAWPGDGAHADARVRRLAVLVQQVLAGP